MALVQIERNQPVSDGLPLLRLGFRPFFLLAGLTALSLIPYWLVLFFKGGPQPTYGLVNWHTHEMIYGYTVAVIAGFLLTAEKNWTGVQTPKGGWLAVLALIWLAGRIVPFTNIAGLILPAWLIASIDLAFLPILAIVLLIPLLKTSQYKQLVFVFIVFLLFISNLLFHLGYLNPGWQTTGIAIKLGWTSIILLITVMGGRVIPFFIERGTGQIGKLRSYRSLELVSFTSLLIWLVYSLASANTLVIAVLAVVAGLFQALRLWGWYIRELWRHPMLWVLYLGYAWIPLGLFLYAYLSLSGAPVSSAVHAFTAGAIGLLTIGMMVRVSLGHTGRNIEASSCIVLAFVFVLFGSLLRVIASITQVDLIANHYVLIVTSAGVMWSIGFLCFVIMFIPVLWRSRIDNRPG
jgi:uncharacterized protein involved in response to NO